MGPNDTAPQSVGLTEWMRRTGGVDSYRPNNPQEIIWWTGAAGVERFDQMVQEYYRMPGTLPGDATIATPGTFTIGTPEQMPPMTREEQYQQDYERLMQSMETQPLDWTVQESPWDTHTTRRREPSVIQSNGTDHPFSGTVWIQPKHSFKAVMCEHGWKDETNPCRICKPCKP